MYITQYIKSLGSSIKYYYDKLENWKNALLIIAGLCILYFSFDPFKILKGYEIYKPIYIALLAFLVLFMAGYRSWKEQFEKNLKDESVTLQADCSTLLTTSWKLHVKFSHITINFNFFIRNMKNHPVNIKKIEVSPFESQVNFKPYFNPSYLNHMINQSALESLGTSDITISRSYNISQLEYIEQVELIDSLKAINSECVITFVSILGEEKITVPVQIDSQKLLIDNFRNRKDTGMNGSPIKVALEKRGVKIEW